MVEPRNPRNRLYELIVEDQMLDKDAMINMMLRWMSWHDVEEMCERNGIELWPEEENDEDETEDDEYESEDEEPEED